MKSLAAPAMKMLKTIHLSRWLLRNLIKDVVSFFQSQADITAPAELLNASCNKHRCPICDKIFQSIGTLKRHYRSHINFKPHICELCGKRFTLNQYLIEHTRTHTGEKPYPCTFCPKSFAQTGTLYHHMKNVHQKYYRR